MRRGLSWEEEVLEWVMRKGSIWMEKEGKAVPKVMTRGPMVGNRVGTPKGYL